MSQIQEKIKPGIYWMRFDKGFWDLYRVDELGFISEFGWDIATDCFPYKHMIEVGDEVTIPEKYKE